MPLPYGTRPRLVLFHVCSEAIRRKSPEVEVERSASGFLDRLGIAKGGESMAAFKRQMLALAACRMQIGYRTETIKDQFGQEYRCDKDFKREFSGALRKAHAVYPDAKMEFVRGGLRLFPSPPPVKRRQVRFFQ